jgi:hypothetical protein
LSRGGSKKRSPRRNSRRKSQRRKSRSKIGGGSNQTGNSWITAVAKARKQLGIKGFQAVRKGTPLYKKAKHIQEQAGGVHGEAHDVQGVVSVGQAPGAGGV